MKTYKKIESSHEEDKSFIRLHRSHGALAERLSFHGRVRDFWSGLVYRERHQRCQFFEVTISTMGGIKAQKHQVILVKRSLVNVIHVVGDVL